MENKAVDLGTVTIDLCNGCGRVVLMNDREPDGRMETGAATPRCIFRRPDFEHVGDATQHTDLGSRGSS
jgi:hypothetical protein